MMKRMKGGKTNICHYLSFKLLPNSKNVRRQKTLKYFTRGDANCKSHTNGSVLLDQGHVKGTTQVRAIPL